MDSDTELPQNVQQAALANQKILAIKLLREANGIRLKEAKNIVEQFMHEHADKIQSSPAGNSSGNSSWLGLIVLATIGYAAYRYFSG